MEITPPLGIGDIIQLKMHCIHHQIELKKININIKLLKKYKGENVYIQYLIFIENFIKSLFKDVIIEKVHHLNPDYVQRLNYQHHIICLKDMYEYQNKINMDKEFDGEYIIFHTKLRLDGVPLHEIQYIQEMINIFCQKFKTNKKILIMGERNICTNYETKLHNIQSLYSNLIKLKKNNNVLDLTYEELVNGNEYINFEKDLKIIENASYNIMLGIGGPVNICLGFSKKNIIYIPIQYYKNIFYSKLIEKIFHSDIEVFENIHSYIDYLLNKL